MKIHADKLTVFCETIFQRCGLSAQHAHDGADVLVRADLRNIPSHGVARLDRYVKGLKSGQIKSSPNVRILTETPVSLVVDADGAMGAAVSISVMNQILEKAEHTSMAFAAVGNSNHFGIAGYYAMMALKHDMIGIAMTNTAALGIPTFAREVMFGTNPFAFAAPGADGKNFVLDMSTTAVTRGKVEVYQREEHPLPEGWAVDKTGHPTSDAGKLLDDMLHRRGGGLLPLGGFGEAQSGYKGYGLAVMVDILSAIASGSDFGKQVCDIPKGDVSARVSHAFGVMKIDCLRNPDDFKRDMARMLTQLNECEQAEGATRVYYAGQKEAEAEKRNRLEGIDLSEATWKKLKAVAAEFDSEMERLLKETVIC
ncbi:MAG: Ldh family oxidoreductase [Victivallaceae bacterium]|nr:Ldh family oxidoreductase [Victivallaceae bacterium]